MPENLTNKEDEEELPAAEQSNWAELPRDALSVIIRSAQFVCRPWRHLSLLPELWRCIDMTGHAVGMEAVRRSSGCLEEFHAVYVGNDELMNFMADRYYLDDTVDMSPSPSASASLIIRSSSPSEAG